MTCHYGSKIILHGDLRYLKFLKIINFIKKIAQLTVHNSELMHNMRVASEKFKKFKFNIKSKKCFFIKLKSNFQKTNCLF